MQFYTLVEIADLVGVPNHVVRYAIREDNIPHIRRVGIIRLFDKDAVRRVREVVARRAAKRAAK
jgi:DNA-binding transcriptional MerR regulator